MAAAAAERISPGICFAPFVSHRNYNSQGEQGSDRERRHQGQPSHLEVTFQSGRQMLPIYLSPAPAPPPSLPPSARCLLLSTSPSSSASLFGVFMLCPPFLHLPPPPLHCPVFHDTHPHRPCDVLTRQRRGSGAIKASANERLSGVNALTYLSQTRGGRSLAPRGGALFHFFGSEASKVQEVTVEDSRSQHLG